MEGPDSKSGDLASRVFEDRWFQAVWAVFPFSMVLQGWPIRNVLLVCWVYGSDAYFHHGIRVLAGKPIRFSNGALAPALLDMITGLGFFFLTTLGLTLFVYAALRSYERHSFRKPGE